MRRSFRGLCGGLLRRSDVLVVSAVVGVSALVSQLLSGGVAAAACTSGTPPVTTVFCTATTTAKATTIKYIGVALVGVVVVLGLMIGIRVLIKLFHRVTGR